MSNVFFYSLVFGVPMVIIALGFLSDSDSGQRRRARYVHHIIHWEYDGPTDTNQMGSTSATLAVGSSPAAVLRQSRRPVRR